MKTSSRLNFNTSNFFYLKVVIFFACLNLSTLLSAQQRTVGGRVTSGDSALSGVTIGVKGTNTATQTDACKFINT